MNMMVVVAAHLHKQGVMLFPYIDDWLLVALSEATLHKHVQETLTLLEELGLHVNLPKSHLLSSYQDKFIGAIIGTVVCRAFLPPLCQ